MTGWGRRTRDRALARAAPWLFVVLSSACKHPRRDETNRSQEQRWRVIHADDPRASAAVASAAQEARARGQMPVLYFAANYTVASTRLVALRDTPPMRAAFEGFFVIQVDGAESEVSGASGYWHVFRGVDASGRPRAAMLDPGTKDGPCTDGDASACAAWVRPFLSSLR